MASKRTYPMRIIIIIELLFREIVDPSSSSNYAVAKKCFNVTFPMQFKLHGHRYYSIIANLLKSSCEEAMA